MGSSLSSKESQAVWLREKVSESIFCSISHYMKATGKAIATLFCFIFLFCRIKEKRLWIKSGELSDHYT